MPDFLTAMKSGSAHRLENARALTPEVELRSRAGDVAAPPTLKLSGSFDLIAEFKRNAPSTGILTSQSADGTEHAVSVAMEYQRGGAVAVSVLTEPTRFNGNLSDLKAIADVLQIPVLRKDFLIDPYQVHEARVNGAGGVLLIIRMLDDDLLLKMADVALEYGMFLLIEAFDQHDLERLDGLNISSAGVLVGVNTRNLATLEVDTTRLAALKDVGPTNCPRVAESGMISDQDIAHAARLGYQLSLVGSALMRDPNPADRLLAMLTAGREAVAQ